MNWQEQKKEKLPVKTVQLSHSHNPDPQNYEQIKTIMLNL